MIIQNKFEPSPEQQMFIDDILGSNFPWYYQEGTGGSYNVYAHAFSYRHPSGLPIAGIENSNLYNITKGILEKFCSDNQIPVNTIFRAAVNSTSSSDGVSGVHTDHDFDHKVLLLYLTECSGNTNIYDCDGVVSVKPEKMKAVVFDGQKHNNEPCNIGERRVVMVFTFN